MDCQVCETIVEICSAGFDEWDEEFLGRVSDVLDSDCPHAESIPRAAIFDQPLAAFPDRLLAVQKEPRQTAVRLGLGEETPEGNIGFDNLSATAVELVYRKDVPNHPGRGILPDKSWINLNIVQDWLSQCSSTHASRCYEPPWLKGVRLVTPEWLIDVVDNCIVSSPAPGTRYVSLSYTWGLGRNLKNTINTTNDLQRPGALETERFSQQLPETIRNTIDLVRAVGERYLWVDALCIIQDDPDSLERNLNQMQLIYASSVFCIMAAAGQGAEFGLPGLKGISKARNVHMDVYELANGEKLTSDPIFQEEQTTQYSYRQRGWTFQEWIFSRRRLIFQPNLLEWRCQCASWKESRVPNTDDDARWTLGSRMKLDALVPSPSIWDFTRLASTFNTRSLTLQEDAPRAFAGIQAMLHRIQPGGLCYGLSEFFFEMYLGWSSLFSDIERRKAANSVKKYQKGLPSWSWMGWHGNITFPYDVEFRLTQPWHQHEQKVGFREPVADWFGMISPTSTTKRRIESRWMECKTKISNLSPPTQPIPGWKSESYNSGNYPFDFYPSTSVLEEVFSHELDPTQKFRYPVPVLDWADDPVLSVQCQFLTCMTTRVCLKLEDDVLLLPVEDCDRRVRLECSNETILSLTVPNTKMGNELTNREKRPKELNLVAFAKGWSTWLGNDFMIDLASSDEPNSGLRKVPGTDPRDCYFVLWVEEEDGILYRVACGEALGFWWDQNKQTSSIILG